MELHSLDLMEPVAQTHDGASAVFFGGPGADFQLCRQILFLNDQRMVARGCHRHRETLKDGSVVVNDRTGLAVHEMRRSNHVAAEGFADGLVSQANTEKWNFACKVADQIDADAGLTRCARPRGDDYAFGPHVLDLGHCYLIVAANLHFGAQFAEVLHQVVGERVVVVEYENQESKPFLSAYIFEDSYHEGHGGQTKEMDILSLSPERATH